MRAQAPAFATARGNQDRHLMMPSPAIHHYCSKAWHSCWLSAGHAQAHVAAPHSIAAERPILPRSSQTARSHRRKRPCFAACRSGQPLQSSPTKPSPRLNPHSARGTLCPHTSRDFVPWRFSDAGRHSAWRGSSCRRSKTCTSTEVAPVKWQIRTRRRFSRRLPAASLTQLTCGMHWGCEGRYQSAQEIAARWQP
jgi:hypothetical protein